MKIQIYIPFADEIDHGKQFAWQDFVGEWILNHNDWKSVKWNWDLMCLDVVLA